MRNSSSACCSKNTLIIVASVTLSIVVLAGAASCGVYYSVFGFELPQISEPDCPLGYGYDKTLRECVDIYDDEDEIEVDGFEGMVHMEKIWKTNIILYSYASAQDFSFTEREKTEIRKNMDILISNLAPACLEFIELVPDKNDKKVEKYMELQKHGQNCQAHVGRKADGKTEIQLGEECFKSEGVILHELMHIVGVYHEMTRPDRDLFLEVDNKKIITKHMKNFIRKNTTKYDMSNVTPYDVYSIMNYSEGQGCKEGQTCMKVKDIFKKKFKINDEYPLENLITKMSATDIVDISRKYECLVQPDTQREYVKYALDMTETLLEYADRMDCTSDSDDLLCKSLWFEAYSYLIDIEGEWCSDYNNEMRAQFCKMNKRELHNQGSQEKINNLAKWFEHHEEELKRNPFSDKV